MFPLYDENPTEIYPLATLLLMGACVGTWVYVQGAGFSEEALMASVCRYGAIPAELTGHGGADSPWGEGPCSLGGLRWPTLFTSMFLHGSWMHLIGNLWFLWIFGNNVEDSMGHGRYLVFYLLCGLAAALTHVGYEASSPLPMVGASGAISGVMGAYLLLYPRVRVYTLFILLVFIRIFPLPAWFFLGYWFLLQLASSTAAVEGGGGGVAFLAHVGGFVAGMVLVPWFYNPVLVRAKRRKVRISRSELRGGGWW